MKCYKVNFQLGWGVFNIIECDKTLLETPREYYHPYLATEEIDEDSFYIVTEDTYDPDYPREKNEKYDKYVEKELFFNSLEAAKNYARKRVLEDISDLKKRIKQLEESLQKI